MIGTTIMFGMVAIGVLGEILTQFFLTVLQQRLGVGPGPAFMASVFRSPPSSSTCAKRPA